MARVLILGAGVAGHTAAQYSKKLLGKDHSVTVVSPNSQWNWIPSNIWVGVGKMGKKQVVFPLAPVYRRIGVDFHQAKAVAIRPEGDNADSTPAVDIEYTDPARAGQTQRLPLRLPHQRHWPPTELRHDRGSWSRRGKLTIRVHLPARPRHVPKTQRVHPIDARRKTPTPGDWNGSRCVYL